MSTAMVVHSGLEGIIAEETRLSHIDGELGELIIAGYPLEEIAPNATYEQLLFLLWHDRLPSEAEYRALRADLAARRALPTATIALLRAAAQQAIDPMDALRMGVDSLSLVASGRPQDDALLAVAASPTIVATYWRLRHNQDPIPPDETLSHAANYLYMLDGQKPSGARVRAMETYLNTVMEHGFNASTFTARVIISTDSDMISAVVGGLGALKGPKHGGAPGPALDMVFEIGQPERAEAVIREKLARGERLMGFGHRIYKVRDPRADVLGAAAQRFFTDGDGADLYALAMHVEKVALRLLEEAKPGRRLQTNVEYYTALILHGLGLATALFTPTFGVARVGGWTAHAFEQIASGRIIRPKAAYRGPRNRRWPAQG